MRKAWTPEQIDTVYGRIEAPVRRKPTSLFCAYCNTCHAECDSSHVLEI